MFSLFEKKFMARLMVLLVCASPLASAWATCQIQDQAVSFPQTIDVQRDTPIGSVLATVQTRMDVTCDSSGSGNLDASWYVHLSPSNPDFGAAPVANTRATSYDGIGLQWRNLNSVTGTTATVSANALNRPDFNRGIAFRGTTTLTDTWTLVKTGPIASGTLTLPPLSFIYKGSNSKKEMGLLATFNFTSANIVSKSCSVKTPSVHIDLGRNSLGQFTGVGSTSRSIPFTIGLSCASGTRVNVELTASADPGQTGTIQLTPGSITASGIGVQLLDEQSNPLALNDRFLHGISADEAYDIKWSARYIQTSNAVISGPANATAIFTLTYL